MSGFGVFFAMLKATLPIFGYKQFTGLFAIRIDTTSIRFRIDRCYFTTIKQDLQPKHIEILVGYGKMVVWI